MAKLSSSLLLILHLIRTFQFAAPLSSSTAESKFRSTEELSRFALTSTGDLFVGGTNILLELNSTSLKVVDRIKTGPKLDSPACHASGCSDSVANASKSMTDNVNKALVVDEEGNNLIVCGSLFQGSCYLHDLSRLQDSVFLPEPVAANDKDSSTYAFIGPQRYNRWGHGNVLYVGTTFTHEGDYRLDVPAISSRNLHDLQFAEFSFSKQSLVRIDAKYRDRFLIDYLYGFSTSTHVYFLTVQRRSHVAGHEDKGRITRLVRACISDPNFDTYSEVTLECMSSDNQKMGIVTAAAIVGGDKTFNYAFNHSSLVGTFVSDDNKDNGQTSSVCSFPMDKIERLFEENIHNCFNGSMQHRNLEYISGPIQEGKCPTMGEGGNILNFCEVGLKISGQYPITAESSIDFQGIASSVTSDPDLSDPILFIGTESGDLKGVSLEGTKGVLFEETSLAENEPIKQLKVISSSSLIYLTSHSVGRIPVASCHMHSTCESCAKSENPYCAWCSQASMCSLLSQCSRETDFLAKGTSKQCVQLVRVVPDVLFTSSARDDIYFYINGIAPEVAGYQAFLCQYSNLDVFEPARKFDGGLICSNPLSKLRNLKLSNSTTISIVHAAPSLSSPDNNKPPVLVREMKIINCSPAESCGECLAINSACQWCFDTQQCRHKNDQLCSGSTTQCPKISNNSVANIKIPNDVPRPVSFSLDNFPQKLASSDLFCMVDVEGAKMKIPANVRGDSVTCEPTRYKYQAAESEIVAKLRLITSSSVLVDETEFKIYKCEYLGIHLGSQDCSLCMAHKDDYGCMWCGSGCQFTETCPNKFEVTGCPSPELFSIKPARGPLEGGTMITLDGINLRGSASTTETRVTVAGRPCPIVQSVQSPSKLTCITGPASVEHNAPIYVETRQGRSKGAMFFEYVKYNVMGLSPRLAPMSGGVEITIFGENLDIGTKTKIYLDNVPCNIRDGTMEQDKLVCILSGSKRPRKISTLTVHKDNAISSVPVSFRITLDPIVQLVKPLRSYSSGGRIISIHGKHFSSLQDVHLLVYVGMNKTVSSECSVINDQLLECLSPQITLEEGVQSMSLEMGLKAANVTHLLHLRKDTLSSSAFTPLEITYVPDPSYFNLSKGYVVSDADALVIEGRNMNLASELGDIDVRIGDKVCNVTSITNTQLLCHPPNYEIIEESGVPPELIVRVGKWMHYNLGSVQYLSGSGEDEYMSEIIGGLAAAAAVVVFVAVILLIMWRHKSSEVEREYKRIQIQMDILEHNVRSECKQAFAELQTDLTDLTLELENSGIPTFPRKSFLMKVFFPGMENHPVASPESNNSNTWMNNDAQVKLQLSQFENSLLDKSFLLEMIYAYENSPNFSVSDKVNFASLLSVFLSTRMDYFSDILRNLIYNFIQSSTIASRQQAQPLHQDMLLRRTETILEKLLTNWLAICLYDYIKDEIGPSLFMLCKAVKYQVEKGPVDAVTQEAKYSLSEHGLLRSSGDHTVISCLVLQRELEEAYEAKVLDCDSISQVKGKILDSVYKNTPFSLRPNVDEIDLEWQCGQDAHVILQDIDLTSEQIDSQFRRINTLRHYGIKNKAIVSLVPKQSFHNQSQIIHSRKLSSPASSSLSKSTTQDGKLCHLQPPESTLTSTSTSASTSQSTSSSSFRSSNLNKTVPEVYLTRLLATKGTLKKFIDDVVLCLTGVHNGRSRFPSSIKWLFDLFDDSVRAASPAQPDMMQHTLKANSLALRVWLMLLRNPDLIHDVGRTQAADNNLHVIAQMLMNACAQTSATTFMTLSKEAPPQQLLFAKDIVEYQARISNFFAEIESLPRISDFDFNCHMNQLSMQHTGMFNDLAAVKEIMMYFNSHLGGLGLHEENTYCSIPSYHPY